MENSSAFEPGKIIKTFVSKKGNVVALRLAQKEDVLAMTDFINEVIAEDTFINLHGKKLTIEEEADYLSKVIENMQKGDAVKLFACINKQIVGSADITRFSHRSKHVGLFGISIKKEFRGEGIGREMLNALIALAKFPMQLRMLELSSFATNKPACALYQSLGFKKVGRVPQKLLHKNEYIDQVIMVREI